MASVAVCSKATYDLLYYPREVHDFYENALKESGQSLSLLYVEGYLRKLI